MDLYSIVLAAGKGTRMKSDKPKVLQSVLDKPMINIILSELNGLNISKNHIVVGYKKEEIKQEVLKKFENISFANQDEQLGTGHAVLQLKDQMQDLKGHTLIMCGDTPLVTKEILDIFLKEHQENKNDLTILSTILENPYGYGRIIRDSKGSVSKIVEQKDATVDEAKVKEINSGIYLVNNELLFKYIQDLQNNNASQEYYLTDIISLFINNNLKVGAYISEDNNVIKGVNSLEDLATASNILKNRINLKHINNGVNIIDPNNTYIGPDVKIDLGTIIYPNNYITGEVIIGKSNIIKPSNYIEDSVIGNNNVIGPMAHIRGNSKLDDNIRVGNFVEIKNSKLEIGVKSAHLTYLGDSEIGKDTNIGCGVITANYDGKNKYKTKIGSNCFIGSNSNLIAPIELEDNVFVAAGTTVTSDIEKDKFVIDRTKMRIKDLKK